MIEYGHVAVGPLVELRQGEHKVLNEFYRSPINQKDALETQFQMTGTETGGFFFNKEYGSSTQQPEELKDSKAIFFQHCGVLIRGGTEEQLKQNPIPFELPLVKAIPLAELINSGIEVRELNDQTRLPSHQKPEN